MNPDRVLDITWGTILKIGVAFLIFYLLYLIRDILIWFIFALIISILFNPAIALLQKRRIPRFLATFLVYIFVFGILGFSIFLIAPIFISEIQQFRELLPLYLEELAPPWREFLDLGVFEIFELFPENFQEWLVGASAGILSALAAIFGGFFATITIFTLAIFLSLEEKGVERTIKILSPKKHEQEVLNLWESCQIKVSGWFGVRILACIFVGIASYIALWLLRINYPFILALFAGVTNIVPIIGPLIAGIVIALIAALDSWLRAFLVVIIFILIQQIEGNILTPILSKKFIGLPPALILISLLIGGKLWGILGAILAIPLAGIIFEFTRDFLKKRKESETSSSLQPPLQPPAQPPPAGPKKNIIW